MSVNENVAAGKSGKWSIRLFGSLEVETPSGSVIPVTRRKTGELLAYLSLNQDRSHSRDELIDRIWGDSEVRDARTRLRQELTWIRSLEGDKPGEPELLVVSRDVIQLNRDVQVDAIHFQALYRMAHRTADWHEKQTLLGSAIAYCRSPLLIGLDPTWIVSERARLARNCGHALLEQAEACRHLADYSTAEECLARLLAREPQSEEAHVALMRLYAAMGQPARIARQFSALAQMFRDEMDMAPSVALTALVDELQVEAARLAASTTAGYQTPFETPAPASAYVSQERILDSGVTAPSQTARKPKVSYANFVVLLVASMVMVAALLTLSHKRHRSTIQPAAANALQWTYLYEPRAGERQNSEGRSIAVDKKQNIYVTGLVQTEKDDADILTLKLSGTGKLLWQDRYSSPEHDCDRAFSVVCDDADGIFVAGDSYVPAHQIDAEGWHLTLLHYTDDGHRLWSARSPMLCHTADECIQVLANKDGGCTLAGTMSYGKRDAFVALRYNREGKLLWTCPVKSNSGAAFASAYAGPDGRTYLCGTAKVEQKSGDAETDWMIACVDSGGHTLWTRLEPGQTPGAASAKKIGVDANGSCYVMGVFQVVDREEPGVTGNKLGLIKYGPDGAKLWERVVSESGPTVMPVGLSLNANFDALIVGNETRADGRSDAAVAMFDTNGSRIQCFHYDNVQTGLNAQVTHAILAEDRHILLEAMICEQSTPLRYHSTAVTVSCAADGSLLTTKEFHPVRNYRHLMNLPRDMVATQLTTVTGQTAVNNQSEQRSLFVVQY